MEVASRMYECLMLNLQMWLFYDVQWVKQIRAPSFGSEESRLLNLNTSDAAGHQEGHPVINPKASTPNVKPYNKDEKTNMNRRKEGKDMTVLRISLLSSHTYHNILSFCAKMAQSGDNKATVLSM